MQLYCELRERLEDAQRMLALYLVRYPKELPRGHILLQHEVRPMGPWLACICFRSTQKRDDSKLTLPPFPLHPRLTLGTV